MKRLENKNVLIIGGASGIGLSTAERFAEEGANVVITGRRKDQLDELVANSDGTLSAEVVDASNPDQIAKVISKFDSEYGKLDVLVVNAGLSEYAELNSTSTEHFDSTFNLNVKSPVFAVKKAATYMQAGGAIVLIGSIAGNIGTIGYGTYGASKAAIRAYTRTWANELALKGIRVNVVCPGPIDTAMFEAVSDDIKNQLSNLIPMKRLGKPEEVANAALFLASDEASYITGIGLSIDGGMSQV